ncbi:MAG: hypothetical protein SOZ00_03135 [Tidjanibacter sp.]|nr:hypothetical protein [Tidjanibacter sp.]
MGLEGYSRTCSKRSGGIKSLHLIEADKILSAAYNSLSGEFEALTLAEGALWAGYDFVEQSGSLTQTLAVAGGSTAVEHRLCFALHGIDQAARLAADSLAESACKGIVAVVETLQGERLLVGYSVLFGGEKALRVERITSSTGAALADKTSTEVVLTAVDTSLSRPFTGTL